ncbi:MAG: tRNA (guanosine(46)-N7)-methyltransferase TrmB [Bacteroidaceae bacterium]|nr:tRNA (guanosine(46)-N7)-methyltransferase TrmB [Bacteroidaceae bacterium]
MGKNKLSKFADMREFPHVFECPFYYKQERPPFPMKGRWREDFFHNDHPIVLELGCGRGEYTIGLAERNPNQNFIGVDIKGARMWSGATEALSKGLKNVAFLRTSIEFIDQFFSEGEVNQIWITFPDPQMKKYTKRLTSTPFLVRYSHILVPNGIIHLKTDSPFLYIYTDALLKESHLPVEVNTTDLYGTTSQQGNESTSDNADRDQHACLLTCRLEAPQNEAASIQTYYESQWLSRGMTIKYIRFRLPASPSLVEPDIEIPLDDYRSYGRTTRSGVASRPAAK